MQIGIGSVVSFVLDACFEPTASNTRATPSYTRYIASSGRLFPRKPGAGAYWKKQNIVTEVLYAKPSLLPSQRRIDIGELPINFGSTSWSTNLGSLVVTG